LWCCVVVVFFFFFFFSSRRRHTRFDCDWSSDVCSSDLHFVGQTPLQIRGARQAGEVVGAGGVGSLGGAPHAVTYEPAQVFHVERSEERRVGKECRSRWWA